MNESMRAARLHGTRDIRIETEPRPVPRPGEELVQVTAVGICGSDLHWYTEGGIGDARLTSPLVIGHEAGGTIVSGPRAGQRVAIDPAVPCGHCEQCLEGNINLCPTVGFLGHGTTDGALREYVAWPGHLLAAVPDDFTDQDVAMLEPLGVAIHAHDLSHQKVADTVLVAGCGPIGLCYQQVARAAGASRVLAVDPLPHRAEAAARLGAEILPHEPEAFHKAMHELTGGRGVDIAVDASGSDAAIALALEAAKPGARVVLAGIPDQDATSFTAATARRKGLTLVMVRRMKDVYPRSIALVEQGLVNVRDLVTATYGLDACAEAFATAADRKGLKVVVSPTRG